MDNSKAQKQAELKVKKIIWDNKKKDMYKKSMERETASFLAASR